jgi:hypothetical protein
MMGKFLEQMSFHILWALPVAVATLLLVNLVLWIS